MNVTGPDGRSRANITLPTVSTLKQVLQEACFKLCLVELGKPSECNGYALKHGRIFLDLATPLRLSGLAPGAKLELVKQNAKVLAIDVALQFAGKVGMARLASEFLSSNSLWSILQRFEGASGGNLKLLQLIEGKLLTPHLLILGREFFGVEKLLETNLADIGVLSGSCLIRLSHRHEVGCTLEGALSAINGSSSSSLPAETLQASSAPPKLPTSIEAFVPVQKETIPTSTTSPSTDRRIVLYEPPSQSPAILPDLPDSHYELGEDDFRMHLSAAQSYTRSLLDAPLVSRIRLLEERQATFLRNHPTVMPPLIFTFIS